MLKFMYNNEVIFYIESEDLNEEYVKNANEEERREYGEDFYSEMSMDISYKGAWIHEGFTLEPCENVHINKKYNGTYDPLLFEEATLETKIEDRTYYDTIYTGNFVIERFYDVHEYEYFELLDI